MPFTISHAIAALPLKRALGRYGSPSALAIGCVAPDFPHFFKIGLHSAQTHTTAGALTYSLAIGLIAYVLFHFLVRPGWARLLPQTIARKLPESVCRPGWPPASIAAVVVSIAVGSLSHVWWDSFTHATAMTTWGSWFGFTLLHIGSYELYVYKLLQYGSGVLGLVGLAWWGMAWYRAAPNQAPVGIDEAGEFRTAMIGIVILVPTVFGAFSAWQQLATTSEQGVGALAFFLARMAFACGKVFLLALVLVSGISLFAYSRKRIGL